MWALAIGFMAALVGIIATWFAAEWLTAGDTGLAQQLRLVTFALIPTMGIALIRAAAAAEMEWRTIAAERLIAGLVRLFATAALAVMGELTVVSASLALAVAPVVGVIAYARLWRRMSQSDRVPDAGEPIVGPSHIASFGLRIWIGSLSGILLSRLDQLLLTPLSGARELGLYVVAVTISEIAILGNSAVRDVLFSSHSREPSWVRVGAAARISNLLCLACALAGAALSPWLVPLVFGKDFAPSVPIVVILLVAMVVGNPGSTVGAGLSGQGRPGVRSVGMMLAAVLNVALLLALAPPLGAVGAAWATLAGVAFAGWFNIAAAVRIFGCRYRDFFWPRRDDMAHVMEVVSRRRRADR